jgi:amino acid permease
VKLLDVFLLYPSFALLIIGLHQVITRSIAENSFAKGFAQSYWILMLALLFFFTYQWRRNRKAKPADQQQPQSAGKKTIPKSNKPGKRR